MNLLHLLEDLRDAYPGSLEETIVTEMVANALDSGATRVGIETDPAAGTLTVTDDGRGMTRAALSRYHDLAYTSKRRGRSIGFAGVGIKLGLLVSDDVVTESRSSRSHLATSWSLSSKNRAPWRWIEPPGMVSQVPAAAAASGGSSTVTGTGVRLYLANPLSPLLDAGFLERQLVDHFRPLLDPAFDPILSPAYPHGIRFSVNGRLLPRSAVEPERVPIRIRVGRQRKPSGVGFVLSGPAVATDEQGIAVSTLGKVIKRGWDWLDLAPGNDVAVTGLIEVPSLAEALTLNKADFIRTGPKGATFLAYRKAIQEPVARLLEEWGDAPRPSASRRPRTRTLERDLRSVLAGLSDDFPLIASLIERRAGGQSRLALGGAAGAGAAPAPASHGTAVNAAGGEPDEATGTPRRSADGAEGPAAVDDGGPPARTSEVALPGAGRRRKAPATYGLAIRFESRPDDDALGRLVDSTIWVNEAHPAYRRALASRSDGYHVAATVALTLAPLAVEAARVQEFVTAFLARWGGAGIGGRKGGT
ncbi:MAG TPA: ATP-binding protein [Longimicrobiales bacterium]|nr:ATP-binding protein [Longimicrobiales bacterium]